MWVSEPHNGHEYVVSAQLSESVLKMLKEAGVPREKRSMRIPDCEAYYRWGRTRDWYIISWIW